MKRFIASLLFFISFGIYLKTLCPTITFADSGELITASYILGIPHPPGSPLYCLLGRLFTFLPFGSIAYRVNLMSAFFASLTVVLIYLIILKIQVNGSTGQRVNGSTGRLADWPTGRPLISHIPPIVASLCFAFSKSFWSCALVAEIYTLKAFFLALLIFILLKWQESHDQPAEGEVSPLRGGRPATSDWRLATCNRYLYLFALLYGLSFSNHITMVLFLPAFLYLFLITDWRQLVKVKNFLSFSLLFLLGLSCYLYLPLRSLADPPLDWGNPQNLANFLHQVTGRLYHYRLFDLPFSKIPFQVKSYGLLILKEFTWLPLIIGLFGLGCLVKRNKRVFTFLGLIFLFDLIFNLGSFQVKAPAHFFISSYLIFSLWIGYGLKNIVSVYSRHFPGRRVGIYSVSLLLLFLPLAPYGALHQEVNHQGDWRAYDWGKNVLESLEKGAILISETSFPLWYLQYVEGIRPDVIIIERLMIDHSSPWYLRQIKGKHHRLEVSPRLRSPDIRDWISNQEFNYPVDFRLIPIDKEKGPTKEVIQSAIINYLITHNIKERPIYLSFYEFPLDRGYFLLAQGLYYQVLPHRPDFTVREPKISNRVEEDPSPHLRLLGYDISNPVVKQGGRFTIAYYWQIRKELSGEEKVFVLFTPQKGGGVMAEEFLSFSPYALFAKEPYQFYEHHLLASGLKTDFHPGEIIREEYLVMVPSLLSPGIYDINLGILPAEKLHLVTLGQIEVKKR